MTDETCADYTHRLEPMKLREGPFFCDECAMKFGPNAVLEQHNGATAALKHHTLLLAAEIRKNTNALAHIKQANVDRDDANTALLDVIEHHNGTGLANHIKRLMRP